MQPNICTTKRVQDDMASSHGSKAQRNDLPDEVKDIIWPALQLGGLAGASGTLVGGFAGIIKSKTPVLFALASGIQWFTLASTFSGTRSVVLHAWGRDKVSPQDIISASAIAGGVSGSAGGLLRGRGHVIPGAIMFALFGAAGQFLFNKADARNSELVEMSPEQKHKDSWLNSKWSPMKILSDGEYEEMLQEKLLRVNVEIAMIDESIAALRNQEPEQTEPNAQPQTIKK
ncbi:hypothetical protein PVAG01_10742 [Phlyctema vagabunda]|uniref:Uncharacterized protein n=1 Tax=Phlyctema vagabunda TaxID=108571 RepID=A0ABR4P358_9HELO